MLRCSANVSLADRPVFAPGGPRHADPTGGRSHMIAALLQEMRHETS
jgi:hypothetical protein